MPRSPRPDFPGIVQHVMQRGNDRLPCFFRDVDYRRYLTSLREAALDNACSIHAYVLMTNHVHLLVAPQESGKVSRMMQALGRRYASYENITYRRTGTLWEGRYKACLVDSADHVLACHRYIELNPVRASRLKRPTLIAGPATTTMPMGTTTHCSLSTATITHWPAKKSIDSQPTAPSSARPSATTASAKSVPSSYNSACWAAQDSRPT